MQISGISGVALRSVPVDGKDDARGLDHAAQAQAKHVMKKRAEEENPAVVVEMGRPAAPAPTYVEQLKVNQAAAEAAGVSPSGGGKPTATVVTAKVEQQVQVEQETQEKAAGEVDADMAAQEDLVKALETAQTAKAESLPSPVQPENQPEKIADRPADQKPVETVDPRWRRYQDAIEATDSSRHPVNGQKKGESDGRAVRG